MSNIKLAHWKRFICLLPVMAAISAFAQANGKLQIHFMNVGQGDGAVLISPLGEIVLFDDGVVNQCAKPVAYLRSIGVRKIDYHLASHYHSDHIGCCGTILAQFPLQKDALDRGESYHTPTFDAYILAIGAKRKTAVAGTTVTLDSGSANPVRIEFIALNGNGVVTDNENDRAFVPSYDSASLMLKSVGISVDSTPLTTRTSKPRSPPRSARLRCTRCITTGAPTARIRAGFLPPRPRLGSFLVATIRMATPRRTRWKRCTRLE